MILGLSCVVLFLVVVIVFVVLVVILLVVVVGRGGYGWEVWAIASSREVEE